MAKVEYLKALAGRFSALDMPIYYELPSPDVMEPFIVVGVSSGVNVPAKTGRVIMDDMQQVDIYLPSTIGRVAAERTLAHAVNLVGRSRNVGTQLLKDDTIGRETYHLVLRITNYIY